MIQGETPGVCKGKRILVVDDDNNLRALLEKTLTSIHHIPVSATNAKHAQQTIGLGEVDLVLSDIQMPGMSGIELLHWIKKNHSAIPVILMTGFSEISEAHEAAELGADNFLAKPFKRTDLAGVIASCFPILTETSVTSAEELPDDIYSKISIGDFLSGREMKFDIYIRLKDHKYIKIAHSGENIETDRIQAYRTKGIQFLYMKKQDLKAYLDFNLTLSSAARSSRIVSQAKKLHLVKHTSEILLEKMYSHEIDRDSFEQAQAFTENAVAILSESPHAGDLLVSLSEHTDFLFAHSLAVSLYSAMIGKAMG